MDFSFTPNEQSKSPLKDFGKDITEMALNNELDPVIGRDEEIRRIIRILSRKTKNNPVLVGDPGVGKTAIVEGLAQKIIQEQVPENLKGKKIVEITVGSLIAGASFQGEFEKRIKSLLQEVEKSNGEIILFIDEIHTLIGAGRTAQGGMDAAQMLKPLLARGKIRLIGATTIDEYRKYMEQDSALERRMQKINVFEPTIQESITILRGIKDRMETFHKVRITDNSLVSAVDLSARYITDRKLPDKAIDLIDEAAAGIQTEMNSKPLELEKHERKLAMLKMESSALSKEKDPKSIQRKETINQDIKNRETDVEKLTKQWKKEKSVVSELSQVKKEIDDLRVKLTTLQGEGKYEKASAVMYKDIPLKEARLKELEDKINKQEFHLVKEAVTQSEIADIVSRWTGIPISRLIKSERDKLLTLRQRLSERVKGQNQVLEKVSEAILRSKANINDPNRPIGSFIFLGPTGVGKTEVARALAAELFDSEKNMVRIDMSEYMEEHSVSRLIGSPPGYVGFDSGGQLTESIRNKPYAIVLFDEIEKAHPKVLDILLQVLDDGKLTDGRGKEINFKNTIVIMTSNIGSNLILENKDINPYELLKNHLRPEFINRIDDIIVFNSLSKESIKQITINELNILKERLNKQNYYISFSQELIDYVAKSSYDPQFGARPLKRFIKQNIETQLAKDIISQKLKYEQNYQITYKNKKIDYQVPKLN